MPFGLSIQAAANVVLGLLLIGLIGLWTYHERSLGQQKCVAAVTAADRKFVQGEQTELDAGEKTSEEIGHELDIDLAKPVVSGPVALPAVLVCPAAASQVRPQPVLPAPSAPGEHHDAPVDPPADRQSADIRPGLDKIADDADAQIGALQRYIVEVCKPQGAASQPGESYPHLMQLPIVPTQAWASMLDKH